MTASLTTWLSYINSDKPLCVGSWCDGSTLHIHMMSVLWENKTHPCWIFICIYVRLSGPEDTFVFYLNTSALCFLLQTVQFWPAGWPSLSTCWTSMSSHLNLPVLMRPLCVKMPKWDRYVHICPNPHLFHQSLSCPDVLIFKWIDDC